MAKAKLRREMVDSSTRLQDISEICVLVLLFCPVYESRFELGQNGDPYFKV